MLAGDFPVFLPAPVPGPVPSHPLPPALTQSTDLIRLDELREDSRFSHLDGSGFQTVIIDSGIDVDHPAFGPDADDDGVADRIVFQHDYFSNDTNASDENGHGTHVTGIAAGSESGHVGMAPAAGIISLKVFGSARSTSSFTIRQGLQWVVDNADDWNIASVNLSLGDNSNRVLASPSFYSAQLEALRAKDILVVAAAGNAFRDFRAAGVSAPASDPAAIAVSASSDLSYTSAGYSQRHPALTDIYAPGSSILAASNGGGYVSFDGTSMAAPHVAGIGVLAQQFAVEQLGRRLTTGEFSDLLRQSGGSFFDIGTQADYPTLDAFALAESILAMASSTVDLLPTDFDLSTAAALRGDSLTVSGTIRNDGTSTSIATTAAVKLSGDAVIHAGGDADLASIPIPVLAAGAEHTFSLDVTLPGPNDPFWLPEHTSFQIGLYVDDQSLVTESHEGNNRNLGAAIDRSPISIVSPPGDLRGSAFAGPSGAMRGDAIEIDFAIENLGLGPIETHDVEFFLSHDTAVEPSDHSLGVVSVGRVDGGGQSEIFRQRLQLPAFDDPFWLPGDGSYTIGIIIDPNESIAETDETNNANVGVAADSLSLWIEVPPTTLTGTVFEDVNRDGIYQPPYEDHFVRNVATTQSVGGDRRISHTLTGLPKAIGDATLIFEAYGDLDETDNFAVLEVDGGFRQNIFDDPVETPGPMFTRVFDEVTLSGEAWHQAVADGTLDLDIAFANFGSFQGTPTYLRITLRYEALDESWASMEVAAGGGVVANQTTSLSIPADAQPIGDGTLTLFATGDVGGADESAMVDLEGIFSTTMLDEGGGDGDYAAASDSVVIPLADLNTLLADRIVDATVTFGAAVDLDYLGNFFALRLDYPIAAEPGMAGITIELDTPGGSDVDATTVTLDDDPNTSANEAGRYAFADVGGGAMTVEVVPPIETAVSVPSIGEHAIDPLDGAKISNLDFGLLDNRPLEIAALNPSDGALQVAPEAALEIGFNRVVAPGSGTLQIFRAGDDGLVESFDVTSAAVQYAGDRIVVTPTQPLVRGLDHYVLIDEGFAVDTAGGLSPAIADASVWNFTIEGGFDFGDAPDSFGTTLSDDGPRHFVIGPRLGRGVTIDDDGQPSPTADADAGDDGVVFAAFANSDATASVQLDLQNAATAKADAWLDANRDGVFSADEKILEAIELVAGTQSVVFDVPTGTLQGDTFARVRVSSSGTSSPIGPAPDGEVEDVSVTINGPAFVSEVIVNGGQDQRSDLRSVALQFSEVVSFDPFALFGLKVRSVDAGQNVSRTRIATNTVGGGTRLTLTFPDSNFASGGTLADGNYEIVFNTNGATNGGIGVDGNGDGLVGGTFRFGGSSVDRFFRLYGDASGDGVVDLLDFGEFRSRFGSSTGQTNFANHLDANLDGNVDLIDFGRFRTNFGRTT